MAHGAYEGVVLAVAGGLLLIDLALDLQLDYCCGLEAVGGAYHIAEQLDIFLGHIVAKHVTYDERQVVRSHSLLLVAKLDYPVGDAAGLLRSQVQMHTLQVLQDIGLAAGLAQGVFALAAEPLRNEVVAVKVVLFVAVGVDSSYLGEDVVANYRTVCGNRGAGVARHQAARLVQTALVYARLDSGHIGQHCLDTCQRGVACAFAETVDASVNAAAARLDGRQGIGNRQVVVVMGVEIKMDAGEPGRHLTDVFGDLGGRKHTQGVGQHKALYAAVLQALYQVENVLGRVLDAVAPVFEIDVHLQPLFTGGGDGFANLCDVLLGAFAQLLAAVALAPLGEQVHHLGPAAGNPAGGGVTIYKSEHFYALQAAVLGGPGTDIAHRLALALRNPCRGYLDAVHAGVLQQETGYEQLLVRNKVHAVGLLAIP